MEMRLVFRPVPEVVEAVLSLCVVLASSAMFSECDMCSENASSIEVHFDVCVDEIDSLVVCMLSHMTPPLVCARHQPLHHAGVG